MPPEVDGLRLEGPPSYRWRQEADHAEGLDDRLLAINDARQLPPLCGRILSADDRHEYVLASRIGKLHLNLGQLVRDLLLDRLQLLIVEHPAGPHLHGRRP